MGHVARRVALDWEHPKDAHGEFVPLHDGFGLTERQAAWDAESKKWDEGFRDDFRGGWIRKNAAEQDMDFDEWHGKRPDPADHMPEWAPDQCVGWMMYENVTEGTPLSPVCKTPIELAMWMAKHPEWVTGHSYETWLSLILAPYRRTRYNESRRLVRGHESGVVDFIENNLTEIYLQLVPKACAMNDDLVRRALHAEVSKMMHDLVTGMLIERANVVCDDSNNPVSVVETCFPQLDISFTFPGQVGIFWPITIGPLAHLTAHVRRGSITLDQVYV